MLVHLITFALCIMHAAATCNGIVTVNTLATTSYSYTVTWTNSWQTMVGGNTIATTSNAGTCPLTYSI